MDAVRPGYREDLWLGQVARMYFGADVFSCVFMLIWAFATIGAGRVIVIAVHVYHRRRDRSVVLAWLAVVVRYYWSCLVLRIV